MLLYREPSTVSISWVMLRTYGRILLGARSLMRWRKKARLASVSQSFVRDIQTKLSASLSPDNCRRSHPWVCTKATLSAPHSPLTGGCLIPCNFKLSCGHTCRSLVRKNLFPSVVCFFTFLTPSVMRTLITIRAHCVTKTVCAWPAYVSTPASDSVIRTVEIASSRFPMWPYPAAT